MLTDKINIKNVNFQARRKYSFQIDNINYTGFYSNKEVNETFDLYIFSNFRLKSMHCNELYLNNFEFHRLSPVIFSLITNNNVFSDSDTDGLSDNDEQDEPNEPNEAYFIINYNEINDEFDDYVTVDANI